MTEIITDDVSLKPVSNGMPKVIQVVSAEKSDQHKSIKYTNIAISKGEIEPDEFIYESGVTFVLDQETEYLYYCTAPQVVNTLLDSKIQDMFEAGKTLSFNRSWKDGNWFLKIVQANKRLDSI